MGPPLSEEQVDKSCRSPRTSCSPYASPPFVRTCTSAGRQFEDSARGARAPATPHPVPAALVKMNAVALSSQANQAGVPTVIGPVASATATNVAPSTRAPVCAMAVSSSAWRGRWSCGLLSIACAGGANRLRIGPRRARPHRVGYSAHLHAWIHNVNDRDQSPAEITQGPRQPV